MLSPLQVGVKQYQNISSVIEGMAGMDIGAMESGATALAFVPWERKNQLPPLDRQVLVGQQAQLIRLQELMQADGRTVLTLWGAAGMVSVASMGTCAFTRDLAL